MTHEEKITLVQTMSNSFDEDTINAMLTIAGSRIVRKAYPFDPDVEEVPVRYHVLQCEIASYLVKRGDSSGKIRHNENGVDIMWASANVPEDMLEYVVPFARAWGGNK